MHDFVNRPRYTPSGRLDAGPFLLHLAALLGVALLAGSGLTWAMASNFHLPVLLGLFPALVLGGIVQFAVRESRCRNRVLAAAAGAAAGLTALLAGYHLDGCGRWGLAWHRLDQLPGYLTFRMETDQWEAVDRWFRAVPQPPQPGVVPLRPFRPGLSTHWAVFLAELGLLAGVPLALGWRTASRPFSETAGRWYAQETLHLDPADGAALQAALRDGSVAAWAARGPRKVAAHDQHCKVTAWYCPRQEGTEPEPNVYLDAAKSGPLLLAPEEAAGLVALLPAVADLAGPALPGLITEADSLGDGTSARVWPVPGPHVGALKTPRQRLLGRLIVCGTSILPVVLLFGTIGLMYFSGPLVEGSAPATMGAFGLTAVVLIALLVFTVRNYNPARRPLPMEMLVRYDRGCLRREVAQRPDLLVNANDPATVYAEQAPRRCWDGKTDRHLIDPVLLLVSTERGAVLAEGDRQRYWIPTEAILDCSTEVLSAMQATTAALYAVVLRVRLGNGTWELPFFPLSHIEGSNNWERAEALRRRILALEPAVPPTEPSSSPPEPPPVVA